MKKADNVFDCDNPDMLEEIGSMQEDLEKFEAAGFYRGRVGETFVCTQHQFYEWDRESYNKREADKFDSEHLANKSFRADEHLIPEQNSQNEFDKQLLRQIMQRLEDVMKGCHSTCKSRGDKVHGDRQLGNKRRVRSMKEAREIKYKEAA